ncbi:50S ribosomal protein L18 [Patescibacteria group bacterium]|nr:50S ribosomal protein L18 [Patescibacteria group bacterium]
MKEKIQKRQRRHKKIRLQIKENRPRLCVFRSLNHIYAQVIKDNKVLASASDFSVKVKGKTNKSFEVGKLIAKKAKEMKIDSVVFDRAGFVFHGRIKAVADGAREGGLKF